MTLQIKQRIEQIRQGEVPDGYKKTSAGIIPFEWGCVRLSGIATPITQSAGTDVYETVSISAGLGFVNQAEKFGKELSGKQYEKYTVLHKGDFSYNKGNSGKYPQGCIYRLKDRTSAAVPNVFESFRIKSGCADYYDQLFASGYLNHQLYRLINHGVRDDGLLNLTQDSFYSCYLPFPSLDEQEKISDYLAVQDRAIELYDKKIEQLKKLKKTFLQKMFPKPDCTLPEWRFSGFTDAWEQRKLGDIAANYKYSIVDGPFGSDLKTADYTEKGVLVMQSNYITGGKFNIKQPYYVSKEKAEHLSRCHCKGGDILVAKIGANFGICNLIPESIDDAVLSSNCLKIDLDKDHDNVFYMQYLNTLYESGFYYSLVGITAQPALSLKFMKELTVPSPTLAEQQIIGMFLTNLDNTITLHQRKSYEEKQKKKSLMQLLLTGIVRVKT